VLALAESVLGEITDELIQIEKKFVEDNESHECRGFARGWDGLSGMEE
jgi:hypothetical protein